METTDHDSGWRPLTPIPAISARERLAPSRDDAMRRVRRSKRGAADGSGAGLAALHRQLS